MDTIKIVKGVFNNEDIIKDRNAVAAAFTDGTIVPLDTKNDENFQKEYLSDTDKQKDIYIATLDMLTPSEASIRFDGKFLLQAQKLTCSPKAHSGDRDIPKEALKALSGNPSGVFLTMPSDVIWNIGNGSHTTQVECAAIAKCGQVKINKEAKFTVTSDLTLTKYDLANETLRASTIVYENPNVNNPIILSDETTFSKGRKVNQANIVAKADMSADFTIKNDTDVNSLNGNYEYIKLNASDGYLILDSTDESILSGGSSNNTFKDVNVTDSRVSNAFEPKTSMFNDGPHYVAIYKKESETATWQKAITVSFNKDKFYPNFYCDDSWFNSDGKQANTSDTVVYSEEPTAGDGYKYTDDESIYLVESKTDTITASSDNCDVDNNGQLTIKTPYDAVEYVKTTFKNPASYSVSFD